MTAKQNERCDIQIEPGRVITGGTQPADAEQALDTISSRLEELGLLGS